MEITRRTTPEIETYGRHLSEIQALLDIELGINDAATDLDLIDAGLLDSLALIDLVDLLSATFDIELDESDMTRENLATVAGMARLVDLRVAR